MTDEKPSQLGTYFLRVWSFLWVSVGVMFISVLGLDLLNSFARSSFETKRWAVWFLAMVLVYSCYYRAQLASLWRKNKITSLQEEMLNALTAEDRCAISKEIQDRIKMERTEIGPFKLEILEIKERLKQINLTDEVHDNLIHLLHEDVNALQNKNSSEGAFREGVHGIR